MHHKCVAIWFLFFSALLGLLLSSGHAADKRFPQYTVIDPNVAFWTDIYSRYSTRQAVVHDSVDLDIVYAVIDLKPDGQKGSRKINRRRMKQACRRYAQLLKQLAADPLAEDADSRRVAALFGSRANRRAFDRARYRVRCQIGQRDRFQAGLIRSGAYIHKIRSIIVSHGLPEDLALLPHVESSFDTNATSKSGAAGMWQFTRSTGRRFMIVNEVLDERRDPFAATHAAARLLKENYDKLGSWPLAITAYNHGTAGMLRAKATHDDYPNIFRSYNGRTFKFASRNFYSEFLAARQVASDYRHYFGNLAIQTPMRSRSVRLDGFVAFADLCQHFKVSPNGLQYMNPAFGPPVISGRKYVPKGYLLHLPGRVGADVGSVAATPADFFKIKQKPSRFYTVVPGDTAGKIARLHHVKLGELVMANGLNKHATIYAGQTLRLPQSGQPASIQSGSRPPALGSVVAGSVTVDETNTLFAIPQNLPVEGPVARYRRPGPAPADLLAMADDNLNLGLLAP